MGTLNKILLISVSFLFVLTGAYALHSRIRLNSQIESLTKQLSDCQAQDTIVGVGTVHVDTVYKTIVHNIATTDTLCTTDTLKWVSSVEIDTFKNFGDSTNPLGVSVWARVWSDGNYRMLIKPTWNPNLAHGEPELPNYGHYGLITAPIVYRGQIHCLAGLTRTDKRYGIFLGALTDGTHIGGGVGLVIRF